MLRYQGLGYKKIADEVGLSRDSVRGYCLRNGLGGCGTELIAEYHKVMEEEFISIRCLNCGSEIEQIVLGERRNTAQYTANKSGEKFTGNPILILVSIEEKNLNP